jgi:ATP-dependent DNA helicase RecQ
MSARLSLMAENSLFDEIHFLFLFQLELKLYHHLMETRADLARRNSTAPYAICNEKTLQKIAKSRPSTEARLRNIDGVNQWLVTKHGAEILATIKRHATDLNLALDFVEKITPLSVSPMPKAADSKSVSSRGDQTRVTPAKEEAWRMWQEEGISFSAIAVSHF